jgi:hypothetical protein
MIGRTENAISTAESKIQNPKSKIPTPAGLAVACFAFAVLLWLTGRGLLALGWPSAWEQRALAAGISEVMLIEIETAAARAGRAGTSEMEAVAYVQGDPATFYQLSTLCRSRPIAIVPVADAAGLRVTDGVPTFLVTHRRASEPGPARPPSELIQSYEFEPSDMVLLDRMSAGAILDASDLPRDVLRLDTVTAR